LRREDFEKLVAQALDELPDEFQKRLENIDVVIEDYPTSHQLSQVGLKGQYSLLGLYEGIPLTQRGNNYFGVLPDKITLFQKPIESICPNEAAIREQVQKTVIHEIAHYFGLSDERLREIERQRKVRRREADD